MKSDSTEKKNIAEDEEGVFVPLSYPEMSIAEIEKLCEMDYADLAATVIGKFFPELNEKMREWTSAYGGFEDGEVAPLLKTDDGIYVLELWHGPTASHSDIAYSLLPYITPESKDKEGVTAKIISQVAYYFSAYCDLCSGGQIGLGDEVDYVTGDFISAVAGYYAYKMGLPVGKIVCAQNGKEKTESELKKLREKIFFKRVSREESRTAIEDYFDEYGYIFDPVSAAAVYLMDEALDGENPVVIISLSSPHKYAGECLRAIGERAGKNETENMRRLEEVTALDIPEALINLTSMEKIFESSTEPDEVSDKQRILIADRENKSR